MTHLTRDGAEGGAVEAAGEPTSLRDVARAASGVAWTVAVLAGVVRLADPTGTHGLAEGPFGVPVPAILALALGGAALWRSADGPSPWARAAAAGVLVLGVVDPWVPMAFAVVSGTPVVGPTLMDGPQTSLCLVLIGLALLLPARGAWQVLAFMCTGIAAVFPLVALVGQLYGMLALAPAPPLVPMPAAAAVGFLALCLGIPVVQPHATVVGMATSNTAGGRTARRMVPVMVTVPVAFGWFVFVLQDAGLCGTQSALSLYAVALVLVLSGVAVQHARSLHEADVARRVAEATLRDREGHVRSVLDSLEEVVWSLGLEPLRCLYVNAAVCGLYARPAADFYADPTLRLSIVHPDDQENVRRMFVDVLAVGSGEIEYRIRRPDDSVRWVHDVWRVLNGPDGRPLRMDGFAVDITDRKEAERTRLELERRSQQLEKLDAVSRLAGGIAHDFNNHLTIIRGHTQFLLKELPPGAALRGRAEKITATVDRGARLVRQLLAVSSEQPAQPTVVDVAQLVHEMTPMVRLLLGEEITLELRAAPGVWRVRADPGQLERVIINLVANAKDAIADAADRGGRGRVVIEVANIDPARSDAALRDRSEAELGGAVPDAGGVMLAVSDDGCGMPAVVQQRLFEPYFTTKPFGRGTGLGLSTAYGVVKQHGGTMTCTSAPGKGTTLRVFLPRCGQVLDAPAVAPAGIESAPAPPVRSAGATILLVEDEDLVRDVLADVLEGAGFCVLAAAHGNEAWRLAEKVGWGIDLLVADVVMPDEPGPVLARRLLQRRPTLKTLLISGYLESRTSEEIGADVRLLQKPFSPDTLLRHVAQLLGDGGPHGSSSGGARCGGTADASPTDGTHGARVASGETTSGGIADVMRCEMGNDGNSLGA